MKLIQMIFCHKIDVILITIFLLTKRLYSRMNMGVNMHNELKLWRASLKDEASRIKNVVSQEIRKHRLRFFYIRFKRLLLNIEILERFIHFIGDFLFRNNAKKFKSLDDCLSNTKIS